MKKSLTLMVLVLLATGCGALRVSPKGCRTDAVWGANPLATREITKAEVEEEKVLDVKAKEHFLVFTDREVRLRTLLEEHGIKCDEVKKLRIVMSTSWFVLREISLKVVKK
jgi:hypothetical protein